MFDSSDCLMADDQVCIERVVLVDIWFGYLAALKLINDLIVARMLEASVIDYQIVEKHNLSGRKVRAELL